MPKINGPSLVTNGHPIDGFVGRQQHLWVCNNGKIKDVSP